MVHPSPTRRATEGEGHILAELRSLIEATCVSHVAVCVRDLKGLAEELVSRGVRPVGDMDAFADAHENVRTFFAYDLDGIIVQLDSGVEG
jgi:hypothetical protein